MVDENPIVIPINMHATGQNKVRKGIIGHKNSASQIFDQFDKEAVKYDAKPWISLVERNDETTVIICSFPLPCIFTSKKAPVQIPIALIKIRIIRSCFLFISITFLFL
ncbi:MAG: hypothetical protein PUE18_04855 [Firmicutes bacterium]|nr:hypothetical protein [Bacillota bacterium]